MTMNSIMNSEKPEEEMSIHASVQIKEEAQELKEVIEPSEIHENLDKENFKEEFADIEIPNEKVQEFENQTINQAVENIEDRPLKVKKRKKKSKQKVLQPLDLPEPPSHLLDSYYDLDLSEEFLSQVLKYVDDLCNFINNGDQNLERSMEVNQGLNSAVNCYRTKLTENKQNLEDPLINQENFTDDFKYEIPDVADQGK